MNLTFSEIVNTSADTSDFKNPANVVPIASQPNTLGVSYVATVINVKSRAFQFFLLEVPDKPLTVGRSYSLDLKTNNPSAIATLDYNQAIVVDPLKPQLGIWQAKSGSIIVDSINGKNYTFRVVGAKMAPLGIGTGTFTLNGTGNVTVP